MAAAQAQTYTLHEVSAASRCSCFPSTSGMASTFENSTSGIAVVRELLEEVYDGFKEGFDTPLLREAKALLQELA
jgi:hypothetical protein